MSIKKQTPFLCIGYIIISLIALTLLIIFPKWTVDDAFIIFRYADNWVQHGELNFNVGENPVQGYTGILWTCLISLGLLFKIDPILITHVLGISSFVLCLLLMQRFLVRLHTREPQILITILIMATAPFMYTHAFSGLETMLFTLLILTSAFQVHRTLSTPNSYNHNCLALILLLLSMCRPEGLIYALIAIAIILYLTYKKPHKKHCTKSAILTYAILFFLPNLIYFIWQWNYYGYPLPNTFYAKLTSHRHSLQIFYHKSPSIFIRQYLLFPALIVGLTYLVSFKRISCLIQKKAFSFMNQQTCLTLLSLFIFAVIVFAQYSRSVLVMNFSHRFFFPFYPISLLALNCFISPAQQSIIKNTLTHKIAIITLGLLLTAQIGSHIIFMKYKEYDFAEGYKQIVYKILKPSAQYLKNRLPSNEWIVVYVDGGAVPFYSKLKTIDFGALSDEYLAHNTDMSIAERMDYLFAKKPGALFFTADKTMYPKEFFSKKEIESFLADPRLKKYTLVKQFCVQNLYWCEIIYLRNDLLTPQDTALISSY